MEAVYQMLHAIYGITDYEEDSLRIHMVPKGPIGQKVVTVKTDRSNISFGCWRSKICSF